MSADRQRLTSAIRRIAKTDPEIRGLLDAADNKGGKPGAAGVGGGAGEGEESRICCDGSVNENPNPGTDTRDPTDGDQDGLNPDDPADLSGLDGGRLTGITDCDTGEPICFDGDGFIPPDNWSEPGISPNYVEGFYWRLSNTAIGGLDERFPIPEPAPGWFCGTSIECYLCQYDGQGYRICYTQTTGPNAGNEEETNGYVSIQSCSGLFDFNYCDPTEEDITITDPGPWPPDGCVNLAIKNGTIVGSKYDPENDGSYSAPRDSIELCDGAGNQISLAPAANGGWKTINSTTNNGYLYDSSGKQIAHIDGNEYSDPSV